MGPAATSVYAAIEAAKAKMNRVYQEALVELAAEMQRPVLQGGNMPVKSGFLRSKLSVEFGGALPTPDSHPGGTGFTYDEAPINARLRTATIRKYKVTLAYAVDYAAHANHQHQFVGLAVQRWPEFVNNAALRAKTSG